MKRIIDRFLYLIFLIVLLIIIGIVSYIIGFIISFILGYNEVPVELILVISFIIIAYLITS
jgi:hypothetical protein